MIQISEDQLKTVEYLIAQSIQGNHVLFDPDVLRRVFAAQSSAFPLEEQEAQAVEPHIEKIMALPTLAQKRAYFEKLDRKTQEKVVRTYFNIVENNLYESLNEGILH